MPTNTAKYVKVRLEAGRTAFVQVHKEGGLLIGGLEVARDGSPIERKCAGGYSRSQIVALKSDVIGEYAMNLKYAELEPVS
jgi:hypothetical protein